MQVALDEIHHIVHGDPCLRQHASKHHREAVRHAFPDMRLSHYASLLRFGGGLDGTVPEYLNITGHEAQGRQTLEAAAQRRHMTCRHPSTCVRAESKEDQFSVCGVS